MAAKDPAVRRTAARIAALSRWSKTDDRAAKTKPGRVAFMRRFEDEVDPNRQLDEHERQRRAGQAMHAHMLRLQLKRHPKTA